MRQAGAAMGCLGSVWKVCHFEIMLVASGSDGDDGLLGAGVRWGVQRWQSGSYMVCQGVQCELDPSVLQDRFAAIVV